MLGLVRLSYVFWCLLNNFLKLFIFNNVKNSFNFVTWLLRMTMSPADFVKTSTVLSNNSRDVRPTRSGFDVRRCSETTLKNVETWKDIKELFELLTIFLTIYFSLSLSLLLSLSVGNLKSYQRRTTLEMIPPTMTMLNRSSSQVSEHATCINSELP